MDELYMRRCLELAGRAKGSTSPNPMVGAVIVKDGRIIGEGFHQTAGGPHAEIAALRSASEDCCGATLYVNLEPCCHFGRTPPCTKAIIDAGIARVVAGMADPNTKVAGRGLKILREAGVAVQVGVLEEECRQLNEVFLKYITYGRPFVIWKTAASLDGKTAAKSGDSRWITGEESRWRVHQLRSEVDAVLVGSGTVRQDNPRLNARPLEQFTRQPWRVVLDGRGRISSEALVFNSPGGPVLWVVGPGSRPTPPSNPAVEVEVMYCPEARIDLSWLLEQLGQREITSILLEGGPTLAASFWQQRLIDKVLWFVAPEIIGGDGISAIGSLGVCRVAEAVTIDNWAVKPVGDDLLLEGYPVWKRGG